MKTLIIVIAMLALAAVRALAGVERTFQGWSKDGSYWIAVEKGLGGEQIVLCPSYKGVKPTWPAGLPADRDEHGCATMTRDAYQAAKLPAIEPPINAVQPAQAGPGGLKLMLRNVRRKGTVAKEVWIVRGKSKLKAGGGELSEHVELGDVFWRADGSAVAISRSSKDDSVESTIEVVDLRKLGPR